MLHATNSNFSWPTLWQTIADHFEDLSSSKFDSLAPEEFARIPISIRELDRVVYENADNFRKFAKGQVNRPDEDKAWAFYLWLTCVDNDDSILTTEKILGTPPDTTKLALLLSDYLYDQVDESPSLNAEILQGNYTANYGSIRSEAEFLIKIDLCIFALLN